MPCLMELERVVMVRTLLNCKRHRLVTLPAGGGAHRGQGDPERSPWRCC